MPRWLWFAPLALLLVALALWGFRLGWRAATLTETDVITHFAARYLNESGAGARVTDCVARPGQTDGVWILVSCTEPEGQRHDYPVDRFGRLLEVSGRKTRLAPET